MIRYLISTIRYLNIMIRYLNIMIRYLNDTFLGKLLLFVDYN